MAHMDIAIGVRRAVVKHEPLASLTLFAQPVVEAELLPPRQDRGFLRGKAGLHREVGLRQEDGVAVIDWGGGVGP